MKISSGNKQRRNGRKPRTMKNPIRPILPCGAVLGRRRIAMLLTLLLTAAVLTLQVSDPSSIIQNPSSTPASPLTDLLGGLVGKYGWLTTVLLAIGSLRILFKPVMLVVENSVKNDPVKLAEVKKFEAGPIYKTIAIILDVAASIKLPLIKPPGDAKN